MNNNIFKINNYIGSWILMLRLYVKDTDRKPNYKPNLPMIEYLMIMMAMAGACGSMYGVYSLLRAWVMYAKPVYVNIQSPEQRLNSKSFGTNTERHV